MAQIITPAQTKEQAVASAIDLQIKNAAQAQKRAYDTIRRLIYANPQFRDEYNAFDPNAVYAAFAENTETGLTPEQLGQMAKVAKASLNMFQPGTITDDVPAATISGV